MISELSCLPVYGGLCYCFDIMVVGVIKITFVLHGNRSLKEKRRVVRSVKDKLKKRFNVSVAEVADHDIHQRATLGLSVTSSDSAHAASQIAKVENMLEEMAPVGELVSELIIR